MRNREREREREIDGSDDIIVVLKLAMSLHFPIPKEQTWNYQTVITISESFFRFEVMALNVHV